MAPIIVVTALAALFSYVIVKPAYEVFFGNLKHIPGPRLAAATRLVSIWQKLNGNVEHWKLNLHLQYGDVVRVAPNDVSLSNGDVWREIYGPASGSQFVRCQKDFRFYGYHDEDPGMLTAPDGIHARQRKCFNNAFSDKALRQHEPLILEYVSQFLANIEQSATSNPPQKIDLAKQYNFATFDIMGDMAFGESIGCLRRSQFIAWIQTIFSSIKFGSMLSEVNHYPNLKRIITMMIPPSIQAVKTNHQNYAAARVDKRLAQETSRLDIWHFVLASEEEKNLTLTRKEMHANSSLFMAAGSETSATLLSGLTYYLLANPDQMKRLTSEIRSRFQTREEIRAQDLHSLKYLTACIQEAFRMHPPVPTGLPRFVAKGGLKVSGYSIPEGTITYIHQLSTYRNPNNFSYPTSYLPERWLTAEERLNSGGTTSLKPEYDTTKFDNDNKSCLQPFSIGPRNCIGQNLAWMEIRLIITHLLWSFDLVLADESKEWNQQQIYALWMTKPLMITARPVVR